VASRLPFTPSFIRFLPSLDARASRCLSAWRSAYPTITGVKIDDTEKELTISFLSFDPIYEFIRGSITRIFIFCLFFCFPLLHRGAAFDTGPFLVTCESFQFYVTGPPEPSFCLFISVAYGPSEAVIPNPFLLFFVPSPLPLSLPSPLSLLSVVSGQINAEVVLHVSETKGSVRVPGSHLITHLELFLPRENVVTLCRVTNYYF